MVGFLAGVTSAADAALALDAGADHLAAVRPDGGALAPVAVSEICRTVAGRRPVSGLVGPVHGPLPGPADAVAMAAAGVDRVTVRLPAGGDRRAALAALAPLAADGLKLTALFFADQAFELELIDAAATAGLDAVFWDTGDKVTPTGLSSTGTPSTRPIGDCGDGAGSTGLTGCRSAGDIEAFVRRARAAGLRVGLAGGLGLDDIDRLVPLAPDLLGFRSGLCLGARTARLNPVACQAVRARLNQALDRARVRAPGLAEVVSVSHLAAVGAPGFGRLRDGDAAPPLPALHPVLSRPAGLPPRPAGPPGDSAPAAAVMADPLDRIFVRDFVLDCRIGIYPEEQDRTQQVRFNVQADVYPNQAHLEDDFRQVFSYDNITDAIRAVTGAGHIGLVETIAERVAARCLAHPYVARITVRVEKLERDPGGVGIEITRSAGGVLRFPATDPTGSVFSDH